LADAQEWWSVKAPIDGTPGATWLDRRLPGHGPYRADDVAWLAPNIAHAGDGGVLFTLRCLGVVVGYELHLLDPERCERAKIKHPRRLCWLERGRRKGPVTFAAFDPPLAQNGKQTVAFCEGWFDQESIRLALPDLTVVGVPGVHWLKRQLLTRGSTVCLFRDGDAAGSAADKLLIGAADHFLLQPDVTVFITDPGHKPDGSKQDTNDHLIEGGIAAVTTLHATAAPYVDLSFDGRIIQLARMRDGSAEYDAGRTRLKTDINAKERDDPHRGIRLETIDKLVKAERVKLGIEVGRDAAASAADDDADALEWFGAIDLGTALQSCADYLHTQVLLPEPYRHLAALFVVFVQLCRQGKGQIKTCFHLNPASSEPGAGKTELGAALHDVIAGSLMPKEGYTRATVQQDVLAALEGGNPNPVLILDEADQQIVGGIVVYINGTTRRGVGFDWNIQQADGRWRKVTLNIFSPMVICGIGDLPKTVASRVATLFMRPPTAGEIEDWQLAHGALIGDTATVEELRRETERLEQLEEAALRVQAHIHAWVAQFDQRLLTPRVPAYLRGELARQGKTLLQLLAIARLAGGEWPARFEAAVKLMFSVEREQSVLVRLLTSIRQALHDQPAIVTGGNSVRPPARRPSDQGRITFDDLFEHMKKDPTEKWDQQAARGELHRYWVRQQLLNEIEGGSAPANWWATPKVGPRRQFHGYTVGQLEPAWKRHRIPSPKDATKDPGEEVHVSSPYSSGKGAATGATRADDPASGTAPCAPVAPVAGVSGDCKEKYTDGLVAAVLELRRNNPQRSLAWLAKQVRQPQARVKAILEVAAEQAP
jgi:hypothetical protein